MSALNPLDEEQVSAWKQRLVGSLSELRDGRVSFIEGIRKVLALANEPRVRDTEFDLFVAIDSETDHLPPERARPSCSKEWLAKCDLEALQVENFYREDVRNQVALLLLRLAPVGADPERQAPPTATSAQSQAVANAPHTEA